MCSLVLLSKMSERNLFLHDSSLEVIINLEVFELWVVSRFKNYYYQNIKLVDPISLSVGEMYFLLSLLQIYFIFIIETEEVGRLLAPNFPSGWQLRIKTNKCYFDSHKIEGKFYVDVSSWRQRKPEKRERERKKVSK